MEIVDESKETYKERTLEDGTTEYVISNSSISTKINYLIKGCGLLRELSKSDETEHICFLSSEKNEGNLKAFRLLSLLDLITYEVIGGDNPEIFIRLNDPEKIRKIVSKQVYYSNDYVDMAREKHLRDVRVLNNFFRNLDNDEERWNYIEDYFAGEDVAKEVNEELPDEITFKDLSDCIIKEKSYPLAEFKKWEEISIFIDNEYKPILTKLANLIPNIPDYLSSQIKFDDFKFNAIMVWANKSVLILDEDTEDRILDICNRIGWSAYKISDIDYDKLKREVE